MDEDKTCDNVPSKQQDCPGQLYRQDINNIIKLTKISDLYKS